MCLKYSKDIPWVMKKISGFVLGFFFNHCKSKLKELWSENMVPETNVSDCQSLYKGQKLEVYEPHYF